MHRFIGLITWWIPTPFLFIKKLNFYSRKAKNKPSWVLLKHYSFSRRTETLWRACLLGCKIFSTKFFLFFFVQKFHVFLRFFGIANFFVNYFFEMLSRNLLSFRSQKKLDSNCSFCFYSAKNFSLNCCWCFLMFSKKAARCCSSCALSFQNALAQRENILEQEKGMNKK